MEGKLTAVSGESPSEMLQAGATKASGLRSASVFASSDVWGLGQMPTVMKPTSESTPETGEVRPSD